MVSERKYIAFDNFIKLLDLLRKNYDVYVPVKKGEQRFYERYTDFTDNVVIGEVRPFEPLKAFFTRARGIVARGFKADVPHADDKPFAIVGVKACDLRGFKIQDHVFLDHERKDPFYAKQREENLIISADCTSSLETCFCLALGGKPYPRTDFDINLTEINNGFLVEAGSKKGQKIVEENASLFQGANDNFISRRDELRKKISAEVKENIEKNDVPPEELFSGVIEKNYESDIWRDEAETCVECGACTAICPTCHCFLLYDQKDEEQMTRLRVWDSCMVKDYARVGGGANPRARLYMRLRNRFEKKFDFFPKTADTYACTGCGRCISACPAKIDIRKVLKRLVSNDGKS